MPHVRAGKIRALGMFSAKRVSGATEVPTVAEAGGPRSRAQRGDVPRARGDAEGNRAARLDRDREDREFARDDGPLRAARLEAVGNTPEQAARFLNDEIAKWAKVINTAGVKAEQ
jgi:tripartite-type tricarboxylate transporter receptor subunit TctC